MRSFNNSPSPVQLFSALFIVRSLNPFIEGIKVINIHLKILKKKKRILDVKVTLERENWNRVFMDLGSHLGNDLEEAKSRGRINAIVGVEICWWKIKKSVLRGGAGQEYRRNH